MNIVLPRRGPRVALRRLRAADLDDFVAYRSDAELGRYQGWSALPAEASLAFLNEMASAPAFAVGQWLQLGIAEGERLIGDIGIVLHEAHSAEIGFTLARPWQGRGLAREALGLAISLLFDECRVTHLKGVTDARNAASARLLEALGMGRTKVENAVFRGQACVEWTYERFAISA